MTGRVKKICYCIIYPQTALSSSPHLAQASCLFLVTVGITWVVSFSPISLSALGICLHFQPW